jgi:hypothetical protein
MYKSGVFMNSIKLRLLYMTLGALFCAVLSACATSPAPVSVASKSDELDAAIRETSNYLNKQLSKGNKLIILNVQSDFPALSEYIIDELIANTVNDRVFSVVDRQQLNTIRAELNFQMSGEVDDATAQSLGRMAGAQIIISGAVSKIGDLYRLRVRALSVQSAQIEGQFNRNIPDGPTVTALVNSKATGYSGGTAVTSTGSASRQGEAARQAGTVTKTAPVSIGIKVAAKKAGTVFFEGAETTKLWADEEYTIPVSGPGVYTVTMKFGNGSETTRQVEINNRGIVTVTFDVEYKVGGTGPAGGIVFYDKTSYSDGWRYLEAAPASTETKASWNTCVQMTDSLVVNGFGEWRLPTRDELNWIYTNLKKKGLGGFGGGTYWTSEELWGWTARALNFSNGEWLRTMGLIGDNMCASKDNAFSIRAVRAF